MKQLRVLLVDDSVPFLDSASDFLSRDSRVLVVGRAQNGREAVQLVEDLAPDLVLMDLAMPVLDGLAATRIIKSAPTSPRVILITLLDAPSYRHSAAAARADSFICKANFTDDVLTAIDALFTAPAPAGSEGSP